jgi:hypothetical protein
MAVAPFLTGKNRNETKSAQGDAIRKMQQNQTELIQQGFGLLVTLEGFRTTRRKPAWAQAKRPRRAVQADAFIPR